MSKPSEVVTDDDVIACMMAEWGITGRLARTCILINHPWAINTRRSLEAFVRRRPEFK